MKYYRITYCIGADTADNRREHTIMAASFERAIERAKEYANAVGDVEIISIRKVKRPY